MIVRPPYEFCASCRRGLAADNGQEDAEDDQGDVASLVVALSLH